MVEHREVARARILADAGRSVEALRSLSAILAREPDQVDALLLFADVHLHHGDSAETLRAGYRLLALEPRDVSALRLVAKANSHLGNHEDAVVAATLALVEAPQDPDAHITRVEVGLATGDTGPEVARSAATAVRLAPQASAAYITLGNFYRKDKKRNLARTAYLEALRISPQSLVARNNLATLDLAKGEVIGSVKAFSRLLRESPNYTHFRSNLVLSILKALRNVRKILFITAFLRGSLAFMIVVVYWGLPRDPLALECVSVIGSALTLLALWGYAAVFWRAGGAGTHRFLRDNYRNGPGFKTVIWILVATVACVIASAFIATQLGLFMILMFIVCVLGSLQLRAERHWYAWTKILTGNAPAR